MDPEEEPRYVISIAARMLRVQTHTLRYYEKIGIIEPYRSQGNIRLYSERELTGAENLAGAEIILRMAQRLTESQRQIERLESEVKRLKKKT